MAPAGSDTKPHHSAPWTAQPWSLKDGVLRIRVRVTPRGGRDAIDGVDTLADGTKVLKVRVRAAPQDGEATGAVRRTLAASLNVAASALTLESGAVSRIKIFAVDGDSTLEHALSTLFA